MKLNLDILSCTAIKRKHPSRKLTWLGNDTKNLVFINKGRIGTVCLPSGETKKNILKLQSEIITISICPAGQILGGILQNGKVFLWQRLTNTVRWIPPLPSELITSYSDEMASLQLYISDGAQNALFVSSSVLFLWHCALDIFSVSQQDIVGEWFLVEPTEDVILPPSNSFEKEIAAAFYQNSVMGYNIKCSFVFNLDEGICITTALIQSSVSTKPLTFNCDSVFAETKWDLLQIPANKLDSRSRLSPETGTFVSRFSRDCDILALAVNVQSSSSAKLLFISLLSRAVLAVDLNRNCHVADIEWTSDDAFVVGVTSTGLFFMVSRLGSTVLLETQGCSMDMGPSIFLPIHPLISSSSEAVGGKEASNAFCQKFSVSCHCRLPCLLVSDGYLASHLEIPSHNFGVQNLVMQFNQDVKKYILLSTSGKSSPNEDSYQSDMHLQNKLSANYFSSFEDSSTAQVSISRGASGASINDDLEVAESFKTADWEDLIITDGFRSFFAGWGLLTSISTKWTSDLHQLCDCLVDYFMNLVAEVLNRDQAVSVDKLNQVLLIDEDLPIPMQQSYYPENIRCLIIIMNQLLQYLKFDSIGCYMLVAAVQVLQKFLKYLFSHKVEEASNSYVVIILRLALDCLKGFDKAMCDNYFYSRSPFLEMEELTLKDDLHFPSSMQKFGSKSNFSCTEVMRATGLLYGSWKRLCKYCTTAFYNAVKHQSIEQLALVRDVLCDLQMIIQNKGWSLHVFKTKLKLVSNEIIEKILYGHHNVLNLSLTGWERLIANINTLSPAVMSRQLHSFMYGMILNGQVKEALNFVFGLLNGFRGNTDALEQLPLKSLGNRAVLATVRSFSRFFAAYFTNNPLKIYPFHCSRKLPSILEPKEVNRMLIVVPIDITNSISTSKLGSILVPELVLELLLLTGLWEEAIWFAEHLGDRRSSFILSAIWKEAKSFLNRRHQTTAPELLPDNLLLDMIKDGLNLSLFLSDELQTISQETKKSGSSKKASNITLYDKNWHPKTQLMKEKDVQQIFLNPAVVFSLNPVPALLQELVTHLKLLVDKHFILLGNEEALLRLPVFCPQPDCEIEKNVSEEVTAEMRFRRQVSSLVHAVLMLLRAANLPSALVSSYVELMHNYWSELDFFPEPLKELLNFCQSAQSNNGKSQSSSFEKLVFKFRDFCAILWILHVEDQLACAHKIMMDVVMSTKPFEKKDNSRYAEACLKVIRWASHLIPLQNTSYFKESLIHLILNTALEAEPSLKAILYLSNALTGEPDGLVRNKEQLETINNAWKMKMASSTSMNKIEKELDENLSVFEQHVETLESLRKTFRESGFMMTLEMTVREQHKKIQRRRDLYKNCGLMLSEDATLEESKIDFAAFEPTNDYFSFLLMVFDVAFLKYLSEDVVPGSEPLIRPYSNDQKDFIFNSSGSVSKLTTYRQSSVLLKHLDISDDYSFTNQSRISVSRSELTSSATSLTGVFPQNSVYSDSRYFDLSLDTLIAALGRKFHPLVEKIIWLLNWQDMQLIYPSTERKKVKSKCNMKVNISFHSMLLSLCFLKYKFQNTESLFEKLSVTLHDSEDAREFLNPDRAEKIDDLATPKTNNDELLANEFNEDEEVNESENKTLNVVVNQDIESSDLNLGESSNDLDIPLSETRKEADFEDKLIKETGSCEDHGLVCQVTEQGECDIGEEVAKLEEQEELLSIASDEQSKGSKNGSPKMKKPLSINSEYFREKHSLRKTLSDSELAVKWPPLLPKTETDVKQVVNCNFKPESNREISLMKSDTFTDAPQENIDVAQREMTSLPTDQMQAMLYPQVTKMIREIGIPLMAGAVGSYISISGQPNIQQLQPKVLASVETQTFHLEAPNNILKESKANLKNSENTEHPVSKINAGVQAHIEEADHRTSPKIRGTSSGSPDVLQNADTLDEVSLIQSQQLASLDDISDSLDSPLEDEAVKTRMIVKKSKNATAPKLLASKMQQTVPKKPISIKKPLYPPVFPVSKPVQLLQMPQPAKPNVMVNVFMTSKFKKHVENSNAFQNGPAYLGYKRATTLKHPGTNEDIATVASLASGMLKGSRQQKLVGLPLLSIASKKDIYKAPTARLIPFRPSPPVVAEKTETNQDSLEKIKEYQLRKATSNQKQSKSEPPHLLATKLDNPALHQSRPKVSANDNSHQNHMSSPSRRRRWQLRNSKTVASQCSLEEPLAEKTDVIKDSKEEIKKLIGEELNAMVKSNIRIFPPAVIEKPTFTPVAQLPFQESFAELQHKISTTLEQLRNPVVNCAAQTDNIPNQDADTLTDEAYSTEASNLIALEPKIGATQKTEQSVQVDIKASSDSSSPALVREENSEKAETELALNENEENANKSLSKVNKEEKSCSPILNLTDRPSECVEQLQNESKELDLITPFIKSTSQLKQSKKKSKEHLTKELERMQQKLNTIEHQSEAIKEEFDEAMQALNVVDKALKQYEALNV